MAKNSFVAEVNFKQRKSAIFSPFDLAYRFQDTLQNKKATWRCYHNANNQFFHLLKEKMPMLWTTETISFEWYQKI